MAATPYPYGQRPNPLDPMGTNMGNPLSAGGPAAPMAPTAPPPPGMSPGGPPAGMPGRHPAGMPGMQPGVGAGMQERGRGGPQGLNRPMTAEEQDNWSKMTPEQQETYTALLAGDYAGRVGAASEDMSRADALRHFKAPGCVRLAA